MCGIVGFLLPRAGLSEEALTALAGTAARRIAHRGPDAHATWCVPEAGLAFGHRRLAIIAPTEEGAQPMHSASGRYTIVFNGEIYNFREVADRLAQEGRDPRSNSDTRVLLAAIEAWGLAKSLEALNGQFAFGLWDRETRRLYLARDRLGQKPLYYGRIGQGFGFASTPAALEPAPGFTGEVDRGALTLLLRHGCVPAPHSIYAGVKKLPAGTWLSVDAEGHASAPAPYWSLPEVAAAGLADPYGGSAEAAVEELDALIADAVRLCLVSDVPLGAFLSGGIDSSTVVAAMQRQSSTPVRTYAIGFSEAAFDESAHAAAVAKELGCQHREERLDEAQTLAAIPEMPRVYDEPFADPSQIPTYLVSQVARQEVTVALSGDGGDELFGGYNRYLWSERLGGLVDKVPTALRRLGAAAILALPIATWDVIVPKLGERVPEELRQGLAGDRLHKLAGVIDAPDRDALYKSLVSLWPQPGKLVPGAVEPASLFMDFAAIPEAAGTLERMQFLDERGYLADDILAKVDRASMGCSLEARVPLLDHRLVAFAWRLPRAMKLKDGKGKWLLREALARHLPRPLFERPKMGFGVPLDRWLRGELRDWAEDLLTPARLAESFDPKPIRRAWQAHLSGRRNMQYALWPVLMFEAWRRR